MVTASPYLFAFTSIMLSMDFLTLLFGVLSKSGGGKVLKSILKLTCYRDVLPGNCGIT